MTSEPTEEQRRSFTEACNALGPAHWIGYDEDTVLAHWEWNKSRSVTITIDNVSPEIYEILCGKDIMNDDTKREIDADGNPLATTVGPDPGNTDPSQLVAPLDPDDDVYDLIDTEQR